MLLLALLLMPMGILASELYFPQSNLAVRIPYLARDDAHISWKMKLLELRTLRNDSTEPSRVNYRVTVPREPTVSIDSETNSLLLHGFPKKGATGFDTIVVVAKEDDSNEAVLEITVEPSRVNGTEIKCADYVQDMCFWNASRYRIYENQPVAMIGTFGPGIYTDLCSNFHVTDYKLLNGTEYFYTSNDTLFANAFLDRDALGPPPRGPGPQVAVQVQCIVWDEITGMQYAPIDTLHIDVLDQDDNPPMAQGNHSIDVILPEFTAGDKLVDDNKLILKDADAESSNRYSVRMLGDAHDAFNVSHNTLPIEVPRGIPYTAIFTRISAKTTLLPKSPYRVILQVKDESLIPGYGENTLNITLTFYGPEHRTTTTTMSPISSGKQQSFTYPSIVKVARLAPRYTRVARPTSEPHTSITFNVHGSSAFAITHKGGIIYVADEDLLKTEPANLVLKVKWNAKDRPISSKTVKINLSAVSMSKLDTCNHSKIGRLHSCANAETPEDCESSCGVASGFYSKGNFSAQCVWRWNKRPNQGSIMSEYYPTCSPDLSHCPDNQCDELERLDPRICAIHGPIVDDHEFPRDLREPYPGKSFGPMGPIDGSLPDDVSFRSLASGQDEAANSMEHLSSNQAMEGHEDESKPSKPEYKIMSVEFHRVETPFIIGIWIFFASLAKIGFHMTSKLSKIFPESCLLIVVGVVVGVLLFQASSVHVSPLTPDTFFLYMLPPIILDAGYFMPNRLFFDHLGTILLFAVIGTIFNTLSIGASLWVLGKSGLFGFETPLLQMFLFSALISAVDPVAVLAVFEEIHVNEILYIVVFGESLLNDAVTVVLYHMFEAYNEIGPTEILYTDVLSGFASFFVVAIGGTIIGVIWGIATGFVTRFTHQVRVIEPIFIFVMAYLAYLNAEIFHMSSILAITFCGITMKNYVEANISHKSHTTVKYTMKMLSSSSETIIFMFLGVATVNNRHDWNTWFVVMTIVFCSVYRIVGVILLTALANQFRLHKLNKVEKFVMSYGGLRGAVAFALVLLIDPKHVSLQPMFVTTTIAVIYFTVFIQGITIKPLVKILNVKRAEKKKPTMNERIHERIMDHVMAGVEDILGKHGNYHVRDKFKRFDNKFVRPYLVRDHCGAEPKILETYSKLAMKDALDYIRRNASTIGNISGTESMSAIFRNYSNTGQFNGSPSCSQLEAGWNIDLQELEYNPSKKDLTDARIHHLLAEELCKPYKRHGTKLLQHRRLSYSRHAVNDRDLSTQVNYKMHMNIRRMMGEHKHRHKRSKKLLKDGKQNHVSFPEFQQNGSTKLFTQDYINGVLYELENGDTSKPSSKEDWDSAITFTARTSDSLNVNVDNHHGATTTTSMDTINTDDPDMKLGRDETYRVTTPTATETMLPWKREDDYDSGHPIKQNEFPAWCSNKEYLAYSSPSATFLGGIEQPKVQSVIGLFRGESVCTPDGIDCQETVDERDEYTLTGTEQTEDSPTKTFSEYEKDSKKAPARRVSMMELCSIEKSQSDKCTEDGSHSLPECWNPQRIRMSSFAYSAQVPSLSTALITSSSESSEEIDEEEEKA